ncbi:LANO_0F05908g1_1 [Lachancea nothofagi CBS 11611]|uniref:LANO_0F05908g1_1 n=1 Tax=Lachancea nothofagi CBS 11611 TaxID=1266666 RepID=A0A1G4K887_9SACH|nr:LANO_0F05908g1_1 [Lachancea nothofagi CBS 11611]
MYKLQVVLVPPNSANGSFPLSLIPATAENSQVLPSSMGANGSAILAGGRPEVLGSGGTNNNLFMSSFMSSHIPQPKLKKLLHFTKPTNTLLTLAEEIVDRCDKIYPDLAQPVEVLTLQDSNECDLDPDYLVKDVFNVDNMVRAVLRRDLEVAEDQPQTLYPIKRRRLNSEAVKSGIPNGNLGSQPNVLHIAKKRPHMLRNSTAMRVSTPLANQIYPPANGRQVNSDYEDDDVGDRSILPPPQPQSQPIRISSGIDSAKKVNFNDNTISRSEAVDPDKSRQQRLPSGTPMRPLKTRVATTPNGIESQDQLLMVNDAEITASATPMATNNRITSGMLRIPEPKISEVEKELRQGPASPSAVLPARPDRIPMKKQDIPMSDDEDESQSSAEDDQIRAEGHIKQVLEPGFKLSASRQTSIADNNGSPIKDGNKIGNVNLAELPSVGRRITRKSSLESKVESLIKNANTLSEKEKEDSRHNRDEAVATRRKDTFSDEDDLEDDRLHQDPNDTVRVNHIDNSGNTSFQKSELLSMLKGNKFDIPSDFSSRSLRSKAGYFENSAEKSKASVKDVINQRLQRSAARKAAELLSTGKSRNPDPPSESEEESSDIETDRSDNDKVTVLENQALKKLNIHPLKERVIGKSLEKQLKAKKNVKVKGGKAITVATPEKGPKSNVGATPSKSAKSSALATTNWDASEKENNNITKSSKDLADNTVSSSAASKTSSRSTPNSEQSADSRTIGEHPPGLTGPQEISSNLIKGISPAPPNPDTKPYQSQEFVEDSDNDSPNVSSLQNGASSTTKSVSKRPPPSVLKRKEDAERKRKERAALKRAREEEHTKKKAEKEAKRREKDEIAAQKKVEREAKKKMKEEETTKKREIKTNSKASEAARSAASEQPVKKSKEQKSANETDSEIQINSKPEKGERGKNGVEAANNLDTGLVLDGKSASDGGNVEPSTSLEPQDLAQYFTTGDKTKATQRPKVSASAPAQSPEEDKASQLQKLKSQYTSGKPPPLERERKDQEPLDKSASSSSNSVEDVPDADSSSDENNSSGDSSSDEDESTTSKKSRRGIVDTPKGAIISLPKRAKASDLSALENAPQSTQQTSADQPLDSLTKVPVTRLMEMSSPISKQQSPSSIRNSKKPQSKPSRSLSSLSDLVSRGVPEVKDVSLKSSQAPFRPTAEKEGSSDEQSQEESDASESQDESDSSNGSSDSDSSSNFISAKSASKALGRHKRSNSGFASLVKDSKKN